MNLRLIAYYIQNRQMTLLEALTPFMLKTLDTVMNDDDENHNHGI